MRTLGNIIWVILGGIWSALGWLITAVVLAITIIGSPFGLQSFKLASLAFVPFGRRVVKSKELAVPSPVPRPAA